MQHDIEALYQRFLPQFIKVLPEGFSIGGEVKPRLDVTIQDEQVVRKLWKHGKVLCHSIDGRTALTESKVCEACSDQRRCTVQVVLYVEVDKTCYRIALNYSSAQNYFAYRRSALDHGGKLAKVLSALSVVPHGSWGEVAFTTVSSS